MSKIERLKKDDYDQLQRFLETSYFHSFNYFPRRYPHVAKKENIDYENSFLIRKEGRIASLIRIFPLTAVAGNQSMEIGGIGSVATHPSYRGKGYMRELMDFCIEEMRERGYAFSILGGDRQRYNFWGFETTGMEVIFTFTPRSIEKSGGNKLAGIKNFSGEEDVLNKIIESHETFPLRIKRNKKDYLALLLERTHTHSWYTEEGNNFAYTVIDGEFDDLTIIELGGNENLWVPIIYSLLKTYSLGRIEVVYPYYKDAGFLTLYYHAESFRIQPLGMIKILFLRNTLLGLGEELKEKCKEGDSFTFEVKETGEKVSIEKKRGDFILSGEEKGEKIVLGETEWVRVIFGPFSPLVSPPQLQHIFPLKFYWWRLDHI